MPRFFVSEENIRDDIVFLYGDDAHHLSRALRMAAGEHITVCDAKGTDYDCILTEFLPDHVSARIVSECRTESEPPYIAVLYQALPKGDKLDQIIQKAVECGASKIVPFESERCVVRLKEGEETRKKERRNRIATEAAKQCGRGILPEVEDSKRFFDVVPDACQFDLALFCYEGKDTIPLGDALRKISRSEGKQPSIAIMIGSEGGFSEAEAKEAIRHGWTPVGLGKRILRTETAPVFVLSAVSYELELS